MTTGVLHHLVERGTTCLSPAYPVIGVGFDDLKLSLGGKLAQIEQLGLWVLVNGRNAAIKWGFFHWLIPSSPSKKSGVMPPTAFDAVARQPRHRRSIQEQASSGSSKPHAPAVHQGGSR